MIPETFLSRAIEEGHALLITEGKTEKIHYLAVDHKENYADPEEKVRAEFWAELVMRYGYEPENIAVEFMIPDRLPSDRADLVIFRDKARKQPFAVIECKREEVSDAEFEQAVEQAFACGTWNKLRCDYMGVVAGETRRFLDISDKFPALERTDNILSDLPAQFGKPPEWKYTKNGKLDLHPVEEWQLNRVFKKCQQTLWASGRLSPPAAFSEMCKILFVKLADEKAPRKKGEAYDVQIKSGEKVEVLAARIRKLYEAQRDKEPDVFTDTIRVDDFRLRTVVSHLEGFDIGHTNLDAKGVAFEKFMGGFFTGDAGQYFTPRPIVEFAIEMLAPDVNDMVIDPACGSGGFLLYTLDRIRKQADEYEERGSVAHFRYWHDFAERRLFGIEISDEISRVAKMSMIIHDDGHTNVVGEDALESWDKLAAKNPGLKKESFDVVLTNPPFGGVVKRDENAYLEGYELGNKTDAKGRIKPRENQKTEILFLERIRDLLRADSGRAAVVLPDGVLTNSSLQYVREWLLDHFQLLAVVSLPATAFSYYGAGVKSSLVFLQKRAKNETPRDDEAIFMAAPEKIGYDASGRMDENHFPEVIKQFRAFQKNPKPFFV